MFQLQKGDRIRIIAPSGIIEETRIKAFVTALQEKDFEVILSKNLFKKDRYLAGSPQERVEDLHQAFEDKQTKAIIAAKGGYGCTQLLPLIDFDLIKENKKSFYGFSDTTALQIAIDELCQMPSITGLCPATDYKESLDPENATWLEFLQVIQSAKFSDKIMQPLNHLTTETIQGKLTGGCLSMIVALMGTKWQATLKNKILIIEEVAEEPYRVDRLLTQLSQAEDFKDLKAIIFGKFHNCLAGYDFHGKIETVLEKFTQNLKTPAFTYEAYGHQPNRNLTAIGPNCQIKNNQLQINLN